MGQIVYKKLFILTHRTISSITYQGPVVAAPSCEDTALVAPKAGLSIIITIIIFVNTVIERQFGCSSFHLSQRRRFPIFDLPQQSSGRRELNVRRRVSSDGSWRAEG